MIYFVNMRSLEYLEWILFFNQIKNLKKYSWILIWKSSDYISNDFRANPLTLWVESEIYCMQKKNLILTNYLRMSSIHMYETQKGNAETKLAIWAPNRCCFNFNMPKYEFNAFVRVIFLILSKISLRKMKILRWKCREFVNVLG